MMNAITEFQKDLVSVCIPCYNVEAYMAKHLRSLMDQTYKKLEVILVDDGSTDGTLGIIEQHVPLLEGCGYVVKVISQENGGQSSAINTALKHFSGEFLTWEDPDDWLAADSIQKRLAFLKSHPSAAFVRSNMSIVSEETGEECGTFEPRERKEPWLMKDFFRRLLLGGTWFAPGSVLVRSEIFIKIYPERDIYVSKPAGQNYQLLLPFAYSYECWQMPEVLSYYLLRNSSHSHSVRSSAERLAYCEMCRDVSLHVIRHIGVPAMYEELVENRYAVMYMDLAIEGGDKATIRRYWKHLKENKSTPVRVKMRYYLRAFVVPTSLWNLYIKVRFKVRRLCRAVLKKLAKV